MSLVRNGTAIKYVYPYKKDRAPRPYTTQTEVFEESNAYGLGSMPGDTLLFEYTVGDPSHELYIKSFSATLGHVGCSGMYCSKSVSTVNTVVLGAPNSASVSASNCKITYDASQKWVSFKRVSDSCTLTLNEFFAAGKYKVSATMDGYGGSAQGGCSYVKATGLPYYDGVKSLNSFTAVTQKSSDSFVKTEPWQFSFYHGCWGYGTLKLTDLTVEHITNDKCTARPTKLCQDTTGFAANNAAADCLCGSAVCTSVTGKFCIAERNTCYTGKLPEKPKEVLVFVDGSNELQIKIQPSDQSSSISVTHYNVNRYIAQETTRTSWEASELACASLGTCHLVSIHSQQENEIVKNTISLSYSNYYWFGLVRLVTC